MAHGTLIVLNGGSSAGKSSTAEALQDLMDERWILLGIDACYRTLPAKQKDHTRVDSSYYSVETTIERGKEYFRLIPGPVFDAIIAAHYHAIAKMLEAGLNVIADEVFWKRDWLIDAVRIFEPFRAFMIGIFVSDDEAEKRHRARGRARRWMASGFRSMHIRRRCPRPGDRYHRPIAAIVRGTNQDSSNVRIGTSRFPEDAPDVGWCRTVRRSTTGFLRAGCSSSLFGAGPLGILTEVIDGRQDGLRD